MRNPEALGSPGWRHCSGCAPGQQCDGHRHQNKLHQRASRRRRGLIKGLVRCAICGVRGHDRRTCPAEPTR